MRARYMNHRWRSASHWSTVVTSTSTERSPLSQPAFVCPEHGPLHSFGFLALFQCCESSEASPQWDPRHIVQGLTANHDGFTLIPLASSGSQSKGSNSQMVWWFPSSFLLYNIVEVNRIPVSVFVISFTDWIEIYCTSLKRKPRKPGTN